MSKLYLPAQVPNEGARRLSAWFLSRSSISARGALASVGVDFGKLDRMVAGELIPGADERFAIALATGHAVLVRDWSSPARGHWGDPVPARTMRRAA
ncbi:hypothetical protein ASE90_01810 [Sphingomonas sp. Leaf67]|uniref:hypothetical protein n=1 Tax=Sphingomonas sp. Leaf67 TaxID=1736230 RepID=UPI0006F93C2F|nr:hypothetical protein [Sphingomonas sp. Leaf67]KQN91564.1 hypothetical protein ASE90_01810 [Sphingomonas sp. Leaf67]